MKAIILLEIQNGRSSVVIVDHKQMEHVNTIRDRLAGTPEVRKATILVAGLTGRVVTAEQYDSPESLAQIASW